MSHHVRSFISPPGSTAFSGPLALARVGACVAWALSVALVFWSVSDTRVSASFVAGMMAVGALVLWLAQRRVVATVRARTQPDWALIRAAADLSPMPVAITGGDNDVVCFNSAYIDLFPDAPDPYATGTDRDAMEAAATRAWRNGSATAGARIDATRECRIDIMRGGTDGDYLIWHFSVDESADEGADVAPLVDRLNAPGLLAVLIGDDGMIRAANAGFVARATGDGNMSLVGEAISPLMRLDSEERVHIARDFGKHRPPRIFDIAIGERLTLLLMIEPDGDAAAANEAALGDDAAQAMIALLPFGLAIVDRDGRFSFMNSAFARAAGLGNNDRPIYPGDIVIAEDKGAVADAVRRYATGQQHRGDIAVRLRSQPDEPVALSVAGVRGIGAASVLLSLKDNSEEVRLRRQVAQASKMQAVGQLAGGIAHDFNNILTAIIGYCDLMLMRHTPGDSDYADIVQIQSNSNRAAALTRQLLAFSRQQTLRPQTLQLPDVISEVSSLLKRSMGDRVRMTVNHRRGLGPVRADPNQLEQVLLNLAVNARDAMREGGELVIETYPVTAAAVARLGIEILPAADYSVIKVTDTGCGIPADILPKIFEPFFTTKDIGKGTGLGLSTVYGIIKQSEGFIFADSRTADACQPGDKTGTSFTIYLPVYRGNEADAPPLEAKGLPSRSVWGSGNVLLVEDEEMVLAVAERALKRVGYAVTTASNGADALRVLASMPAIDLLVSDVVMPQMDGPTLAKQVRAQYPHLPVLFMSGYAEEQLRQMIPMDHVAFLPKPFSVAQLTERVQLTLAEAGKTLPRRDLA